MRIHEPECVALKRRGAEYVAQLLSGKSRQEQLEFWIRRTERLLSEQKQRQRNNSITAGRAKSFLCPLCPDIPASNQIKP